MNITIWGKSRKLCVERLVQVYGEDIHILDESPILSKTSELIGFRFICKYGE